MGNIEKNTIATGKEKGKNKPDASFESIKKAMDKIKQTEDSEQQKDKKILNVLEQEMQASESHASTWGQPMTQTRIQKKVEIYKQTIRTRMTRHPERPPEVGEAALSVVETIATSDQDPNIIARSIGKIMKFILQF